MEHTFTPERRLEIYKEARKINEFIGYHGLLCVVVGNAVCNNTEETPWDYWHEMQLHFPEFRHWHCTLYKEFTPTQRREILESAIAEVTELINSKA
jgi:hypothetical protein